MWKERVSLRGIITWENDQIRKHHETKTEKNRKRILATNWGSKTIFQVSFEEITQFFQLTAYYFDNWNPWLTIHDCFFRQVILYPLCALWEISKQIWIVFFVQVGSNYLEVKFKVFKKDRDKYFRSVQNLSMGEADIKKFETCCSREL